MTSIIKQSNECFQSSSSRNTILMSVERVAQVKRIALVTKVVLVRVAPVTKVVMEENSFNSMNKQRSVTSMTGI